MNFPECVLLAVTYLGTASFVLDISGTRILTDPGDLFTDRFSQKKARTLHDVDLILVTHSDLDHTNRLGLIPGVAGIHTMAPSSVHERFPGLRIITDEKHSVKGITITALRSVLGVRHGIPHRSYAIDYGDLSICFLGDAYELVDWPERTPDVLFVTIGGCEADAERAMKLVGLLKPAAVVPMHWEVLFRSDRKARKFQRAMKERFPAIRCVVPAFDTPFGVR